jgi:hypothetical protein
MEAELMVVPTVVPNVRSFSNVIRSDQPTPLPTTKLQSEIEAVATILRRNQAISGENELTVNAIKELAARKWVYVHHYPFEWIFGFIIVMGLFLWQWWVGRKAADLILSLEVRLKKHEEDFAAEDNDTAAKDGVA